MCICSTHLKAYVHMCRSIHSWLALAANSTVNSCLHVACECDPLSQKWRHVFQEDYDITGNQLSGVHYFDQFVGVFHIFVCLRHESLVYHTYP